MQTCFEEGEDVLRRVLRFKVEGRRNLGCPGTTRNRQVEDEIRMIGLRKDDSINQAHFKME